MLAKGCFCKKLRGHLGFKKPQEKSHNAKKPKGGRFGLHSTLASIKTLGLVRDSNHRTLPTSQTSQSSSPS